MAESDVPKNLPSDYFDQKSGGMNLGGLRSTKKTCVCGHYEPSSTEGLKDDSCKNCGGIPPSTDRRYRKAV